MTRQPTPDRPVAAAARRAAATGHLSAVAVAVAVIVVAGRPVIWAGMVAFVGPLVVLLTAGRRHPFAQKHAREAVWFNLSVGLYLGVIVVALLVTPASPYTIQFVPFLIFLNLLIAFNWLVFTAISAYRASRGLAITYPLTIRWRAGRQRRRVPDEHAS
jgi:uncharacterized Tic20 family protein